MRRLLILIMVLAVVAFNSAVLPAGVTAQDNSATPDASADRESRGVPPEECQIEPRVADEVHALLGLVDGGEASPAPRTPIPAPPWTAADEETVAAAEATAREWLACINADDNLRIAALMTDAAITRFFANNLRTAEEIERARENLAAAPEPREEQRRARLLHVTDVSLLDDGRVAALIVINEPLLQPRGTEALLLIFAQVGERWLLDDIIQFSIVPVLAGTPEAGTPQP
jgi:ketosteroid isomerase-like protein